MAYTVWDLLWFFLVYSALGWLNETIWLSLVNHRFHNRGLLSLPFCPAYGLTMDVLIIIIPTLQGRPVLQWLACLVFTSAGAYLAGGITRRITGSTLWRYEEHILLANHHWRILLYNVTLATGALLLVSIVHPFFYIVTQLMPSWLLKVLTAIGCAAIILEFITVLLASRAAIRPHRTSASRYTRLLEQRIVPAIQRRLHRAYPASQPSDATAASSRVFAPGLCFEKLIWLFYITALMGDIIETFYVRATAGIWMSRSSLLYQPLSIVWGLGAVVLTLILHRLANREDRYIFLGGFFLGGAYEYLCSVFTEWAFGTVFWDYSSMPFNIGGRTNLLFCLFWGIIALVWIKLLYPRLSKGIEKLPIPLGRVLTWVMVLLLICDGTISTMAMLRYQARLDQVPATHAIERFLDTNYPDERIENAWPNMVQK